MIKQKKNGNLIIISGTTCAGKGTVIRKLLENHNDLLLSTSYTSRPMREGDVDGVDYYFISKEEFERKIQNDDFLEYAVVHYGDYYGTPKKEVLELLDSGKDVILEIDVQGAKLIKEKYPETILIFIAAVALVGTVVWVTRLKTRGVARVLINSLAGGALIAGLSAFNIIVLPVNAFNALIVGLLGLPGAGVVVAAAMLL